MSFEHKQEPKEMFSLRETAPGKYVARINSSSLDVMQACTRKAHFMFNWGNVPGSSNDQSYGTLVHKVMQDYYSNDDRSIEAMTAHWNKRYDESGYTPKSKEVTGKNPSKTKETGLAAMVNYVARFKDDGYLPALGPEGSVCEAKFSLLPFSAYLGTTVIDIEVFGTIDMIVRDKAGHYFVMDHKTAKTLGEEFANRWNPNHQMTAYILGAQSLGFSTETAIINGIQLAITKHDVMRIETSRHNDDIIAFQNTVKSEVLRFIMETGLLRKNISAEEIERQVPHAGYMVCSEWGGCKFQSLCALSAKQRLAALAAPTIRITDT